MTQKELKLRDEHPDLHDKLRVVPLLHYTTDSARLTLDDMERGLSSSSAPEFLARCFARKSNYNTLRDSLKTGEDEPIADQEAKKRIRKAVAGLTETQEGKQRLVDAFTETVGGSLGFMPKHPIRIARMAGLLQSPEGLQLYESMYSTAEGSNAMGDFGMNPVAAHIMQGINTVSGGKPVEMILKAKVEGHKIRKKENTAKLWSMSRPVETDHLTEGMSDGQIAGVLEGTDKNKSFELISEFFSSDAKFSRFMEFTEKPENRRLLTDVMARNPARTVMSFFDVLKTPEGGERLAEAIVERNDIIRGIATCGLGYTDITPQEAMQFRSDEAMHSVFNAPDGSGVKVMKKVISSPKGIAAGARILVEEALMRVKQHVGGIGDVPLPEDVLADIRAHRTKQA